MCKADSDWACDLMLNEMEHVACDDERGRRLFLGGRRCLLQM